MNNKIEYICAWRQFSEDRGNFYITLFRLEYIISHNRFLLPLLILCLAYASCGRENLDEKDKTVFRYNEAAGITSLDPAFARDQANIWAAHQVFNGLGDVHKASTTWDFKPKMFCQRFHDCLTY